MSGDSIDRCSVATDPTTEFLRSASIRDAAMKAYVHNSDVLALRRAALGRSRNPPKKDIREGDVVYIWRDNVRFNIKGWLAPGLAIAINAPQSSVWVSMRGVIVKCNIERVRPATDQEWLGAEIIRVLSAEAKASLERKGQRGYVAAMNESGPEELPGSSSQQPSAEDSTGNRNQEVRDGQMPSIPEDREADP